MRYETPMAEIMTDIRGAERKGLYASLSTSTPRTTVATITIGIAT